MKTAAFVLQFVFLTSIFSCQEKKEISTDVNKEIIAVVENETRFFYNKDFKNWSSCFKQDESVFWVCVEPAILLRANGWSDLSKFVGDWMKENPEPIDYKKANFKMNGIKINVEEKMATIKFNYTNQNKDVAVNNSLESRTLIFKENQWRIVSMTSYPNDQERGSTTNIYNYNYKK